MAALFGRVAAGLMETGGGLGGGLGQAAAGGAASGLIGGLFNEMTDGEGDGLGFGVFDGDLGQTLQIFGIFWPNSAKLGAKMAYFDQNVRKKFKIAEFWLKR